MGASGIETETLARTPGSGSFPLEFLRPAATTEASGAAASLALSLPPAPQLPSDATAAGRVDAFYRFFFPAHPFLLPRAHLLDALAARRTRPLLRLAVEYVGCFYVLGAPREACEAALARALEHDPPASRDAAYVQAMVLYAVGLHMAGREPESAPVMYAAIRAALELGMNRRAFAAAQVGAGSVVEESLRRTWWEIFVLDGMFSGVNLEYRIQLSDVPTDIPLPIEETDYVNGVSPPPSIHTRTNF
jgi:Fungal specific transcription factor domain